MVHEGFVIHFVVVTLGNRAIEAGGQPRFPNFDVDANVTADQLGEDEVVLGLITQFDASSSR
jgi:hypothetical protein